MDGSSLTGGNQSDCADAKIYTIIAIFSVGDYTDADQCWVAHFAKREDAVQAFEKKLSECGCKLFVESIFDEILSAGCCYDAENGTERTRFFIRHEPVRTRFDAAAIAWD